MKSECACPIDKAVVLFNKKWTIQLIMDMFFGKKQFKEFQEDKPDLSNKVLSQRLKELENNGLVEKKVLIRLKTILNKLLIFKIKFYNFLEGFLKSQLL